VISGRWSLPANFTPPSAMNFVSPFFFFYQKYKTAGFQEVGSKKDWPATCGRRKGHYKWLASQPRCLDITKMTHPFKGTWRRSTITAAHRVVMEMTASKCPLNDLWQKPSGVSQADAFVSDTFWVRLKHY